MAASVNGDARRPRILLVAAVIAVAVALWWPLTQVYWFHSHEMQDYVSRTVEYRDALARGDLYPRWAPSFYGGYGSPFFSFYPPVVYWLAGALALATDSLTVALKLVLLLASIGAGLGTFLLVQHETRRDDAAAIAACLYLAAPYRLADVSWRGDIAETLALGLLPLALWSYRRIAFAEHAEQLAPRSLLAMLLHATLICTHTISGLWGTGFIAVLGLLSVTQLWKRRSPGRSAAVAITFGCALLTSTFYTLPALYEKPLVRTETMIHHTAAPLNNLLRPIALWDEGPMHAAPLIALATAAILLALLGTRLRGLRAPLAVLWWLAGSLALVTLTLTWSEKIWHARVLPFGDFIQFPWRLLGPAALGAAVSFGAAFALLVPRRSGFAWLAAPLAAGALAWAWPEAAVTAMPVDKVALTAERLRNEWVRGTAMDEYLPRAVTEVTRKVSKTVAQSQGELGVVDATSDGTDHTLVASALSPGALDLELHAYPGWRVETLRGPTPVTLDTNEHGFVRLHFHERGDYHLHVALGATPARQLAWFLSLLGLLSAWPCVSRVARRITVPRHRERSASHEGAVPA
jgi:hypothetical protein